MQHELPWWKEVSLALLTWVFRYEIKNTISLMVGEKKGGNMQLQKPWDLSALVAQLKSQGLDIGEEAARDLVGDVLDFVDQSVTLTPNPMDDLAKLLTTQVRPIALAQIDKLNGKVG